MRILSIVSLASPDGEYGGPLRVAVNQAEELRRRGHDVVIAGSYRGWRRPPARLGSVPARLFRARTAIPGAGFAGLVAPGLLPFLWRSVTGADVVHVHLARDLVTLPAAAIARARGVPFVLQTHGMIDASSKRLAAPLDAIATRPLLRRASAVLHLTDREREDLIGVGGAGIRLVRLGNGVPESGLERDRTSSEVLYLARLAPRKRPLAFVHAARELAKEFAETSFRLVGPDEGEGSAVSAAVDGDRIRWEGALPPESTLDRMRRASVYVLPSVDEPYPMSVLEAMSLALPVVVTRSNGLAGAVRGAGAGLVVDEDQDALTAAVRTMLADPEAARLMGERARTLVRERFSMQAVAQALVDVYSAAARGSRHRPSGARGRGRRR